MVCGGNVSYVCAVEQECNLHPRLLLIFYLLKIKNDDDDDDD